MRMTWHDLLFLHWPVPPAVMRPLVPRELELDTFAGEAWIGIVPFRMSGIRLRRLPPVPGTAAFPEINVRTYVTGGGRAGVWFFSLDAAHRLAVRVARAWFGLPYHHAQISVGPTSGGIRYHSTRGSEPAAAFRGEYRPAGVKLHAQPGSLDHWLTERYCLFARDQGGTVGYGDIHHHPWPLQPASVSIELNTMADPLGIALPATPPVARFARRLEVVAWSLRPIGEP